jgi:hypothetical protein
MVALLKWRTAGTRPRKPRGTAHRSERRPSPGEGSVYGSADGKRYRGAITWTDPDGTRHRRVVSAPTSQQARDKLDDLRRELRIGTLAPARRDLTVGTYLTAWLERDRMRVRPSTHKSRDMPCGSTSCPRSDACRCRGSPRPMSNGR